MIVLYFILCSTPLCQSSGQSDPETDPAQKTPKITDPVQKTPKITDPAEKWSKMLRSGGLLTLHRMTDTGVYSKS